MYSYLAHALATDRIEWVERPSLAILPVGTGNDLARCMRWGGGYEGENLRQVLKRVSQGSTVLLDRWRLEFSETKTNSHVNRVPRPIAPDDSLDLSLEDSFHSSEAGDELGDPIPSTIMNNYFTIGVDASVAFRFHMERERFPDKFKSRIRNKVFYVDFALKELVAATCKNLHHNVDILCDGKPLDLAHGVPLEGIAVLNIPSIYAGRNIWGESTGRAPAVKKGGSSGETNSGRGGRGNDSAPPSVPLSMHTSPSAQSLLSAASQQQQQLASATQSYSDKKLELVGIQDTFHMSQVSVGLQTGRRLAQCSEIVIKTRKRFPMQVDGEPWMQPPSTIAIRHLNQVPVITAPPPERRCHGIFGIFGSSK